MHTLILAGTSILAIAPSTQVTTHAWGWDTPGARWPSNAGVTVAEVESLPAGCAPGWSYDGESFEAPAADPGPVPPVVSRFQARAALLATAATDGISASMLEQVEAAVAGLGDPFVSLAWAEAVEWKRASPTVAALAVAVGLSSSDLDDLFRAAALIEA